MGQSNGIRRVTLQDIARETGYSINTVSHALRNKDDIARETRERIQRVAQDMGYMGNQIASSLRSGRTRTLAVILGNMSNPFYGIMADTIQDVAAARDYSLQIMCSRERAELEQRLVESAVSRRVDGILLFPTNDSLPTVKRLQALGIPFVLMSRTLGDGIADSVTSDEVQGAYLAAAHLIEHGHRALGRRNRANLMFRLKVGKPQKLLGRVLGRRHYGKSICPARVKEDALYLCEGANDERRGFGVRSAILRVFRRLVRAARRASQPRLDGRPKHLPRVLDQLLARVA